MKKQYIECVSCMKREATIEVPGCGHYCQICVKGFEGDEDESAACTSKSL